MEELFRTGFLVAVKYSCFYMFPLPGEKLEREEVDILIKECCDPEDDDGFIPYERKSNIIYETNHPYFHTFQQPKFVS